MAGDQSRSASAWPCRLVDPDAMLDLFGATQRCDVTTCAVIPPATITMAKRDDSAIVHPSPSGNSADVFSNVAADAP